MRLNFSYAYWAFIFLLYECFCPIFFPIFYWIIFILLFKKCLLFWLLISICVTNIYLFISFMIFLVVRKILILTWSRLSVFFLYGLLCVYVCVLFRKSLFYCKFVKIFYMFSVKNKILLFTFRFQIYMELIFCEWCGTEISCY